MSQTSESTYLYAQDNKDLYHQVLEQFNDKDCVFSRNLLAFIESPQQQPGPFYSKHINECPHCQKMAREFSQTLKRVQALIPDEAPPEGFSQAIRPELKEAARFWNKKVKLATQKENGLNFEFLEQAVKDFFFEALLSKNFAKGLGYAALSALLVYFIV